MKEIRIIIAESKENDFIYMEVEDNNGNLLLETTITKYGANKLIEENEVIQTKQLSNHTRTVLIKRT